MPSAGVGLYRRPRTSPCGAAGPPSFRSPQVVANRFARDLVQPQRGVVERGRARVYLFGIAGARDRTWLTPAVDRAFSESGEVWLENAPQPPPDGAPPDATLLKVITELTQDGSRTFYDALQPRVRARAREYVQTLGIDSRTIEHSRPWWAYFTINGAFWQKHPVRSTENVDAVLSERARGAGKALRYEFETPAATFKFFSAMSDEVQSQFIEMLLDYLDDEQNGRNEEAFAWTKGQPSTRALDRMRTSTPALYRVIQVERNAWWTRNIDQLLRRGGQFFVVIGMNHVLGPDSIQAQLHRSGVGTPTDVGA